MKTALHYAAENKDPLTVNALIRLGAYVNPFDEVSIRI